jgi:recombination protein RecR
MDAYTKTMERLIEALGRLPGIGRRSAERIAFHLLEGDEAEVLALAEAVRDLKAKIGHCADCGALAEAKRCAICSNPRRDRSRICVVEKPKDILRLEATDRYDGLYHVLGGLLAPAEGRGPEALNLDALGRRVKAGEAKEVILALGATAEGDATALLVAEHLRGTGVRVTRLARGLPAGAGLEYANQGMLADALRDRREMDS